MNPLMKRLSALRRRLLLVVSLRGGCWLLALVVGGILLAGGLDWAVRLPGLVRALLLVGLLGGAGVLAYRSLIKPLWARTDDLSLALRVEDHYPHLNDSLASTIQFLAQAGKTKMSGSSTLRREAVRQAMRQAQGCDFNKVVNTRGLVPGAFVMLVGVAGAVLLGLWFPAQAWMALARLADPFGGHEFPRQTLIAVQYEPRVPAGLPFAIRVTLNGVIPKDAAVDFEGLPGVGRETFEVVADAKAGTAFFAVPIDMSQQQGNFRFRIHANDAVSPAQAEAWHEVAVVQPPELTSLRVHMEYPAYTDLAAEDLPSGLDSLQAPVVFGTRFLFQGTTDRPVARVWLTCTPREPHVAAGLRANLQVVSAPLAPDRKSFSATLLPLVSGTYVLHWEDEEGIGQRRVFTLNVKPDEAPKLELECLSLPSRAALATPNANLSLRIKATDDFAVRSLTLEYKRKETREGPFLDAGWQRVPMYDHAGTGLLLSRMIFSGLAGGQVPAASLRLRLKEVKAKMQWPIEGLVKEGNILLLRAVADDFDDVSPGKAPGVSATLEIEIAAAPKVKAAIEEAMQRVQEQLAKLSMKKKPDSREPDPLEKVKAAEKLLADKKDLSPEDVQNLRKVRDEYGDVKESIGKDAEEKDKLRAEVERIRRSMQDNRLPRSTAQDKMERVARSLRVLEDEIKEIRDGLKRVLRDEEDPADKRRQPELRQRDLEEVRRRQEAMEKTLRDLLDDLDPEILRQVMQEKARRIRDEQKKIQEATEQVEKDPKLPAEQRRKELAKLADRQKRLADQAARLLNEMKEARGKRAQEDPETARLLDNAVKEANVTRNRRTNQVDEHMRQAEQDLRDGRTGNAQTKQREIRDAMDRVAGALDKNREQELARLTERQQQEQEKLFQLKDDMDRLRKEAQRRREQDTKVGAVGPALAARQMEEEKRREMKRLQDEADRLKKKIKEAEKIPDEKERADRLAKLKQDLKDREEEMDQLAQEKPPRDMKELAHEQRELQKKAERVARRLSRIRADEAADQVRRASRKMEEAARQMDNGEDPDPKQEDALERLNNADQKLQKANEQVENELAREKLAKVADEIKRLKEKQDAAIEASTRLHKELMETKKWSRGQQTSLVDLKNIRQKGLADEAVFLREKLKDAPVFGHILERTHKAMIRAAARMDERLQAAGDRVGRPLTPAEIADENKADAETQQYQREASRRLQRLLDALKNEPGAGNQPEPAEPGGDPGEGGGGGQAGGGQPPDGGQGDGPPPANQDGIPNLAEQKALRAEQQEVLERTKDFDGRHPELDKLSDEEKLKRVQGKDREELQDIYDDQKKVRTLADQLFAGAPKEGDKS